MSRIIHRLRRSDLTKVAVTVISRLLVGGALLAQSPLPSESSALPVTAPCPNPSVLDRQALDRAVEVRAAVAKDPCTARSTLLRLASDQDWYVRSSTALNENLSPVLLSNLANDVSPPVRLSVALNKRTPASLLEKLARDEDFNVASAAIRNANASSGLLEDASHSLQWWMRVSVAQNPATTILLLRRLASDSEPYVRYTALKELSARKPGTEN